MEVSIELGANVTEVRLEQPLKAEAPMVVTLIGTASEVREEQD